MTKNEAIIKINELQDQINEYQKHIDELRQSIDKVDFTQPAQTYLKNPNATPIADRGMLDLDTSNPHGFDRRRGYYL